MAQYFSALRTETCSIYWWYY